MAHFVRGMACSVAPFWLVIAALAAPAHAAERSLLRAPEHREMAIVAPERFHKALAKFEAYRANQRPTKLASLESILKETEGRGRSRAAQALAVLGRGRSSSCVTCSWSAMPTSCRCDTWFWTASRHAAFDYAFYPSDLYYADVARRDGSFDDWNARKDGFHARYFGEVRGEKNKTDPINFDRIDYRAELAVGRWPVDSDAEVELVAEKTMAEDRAVLAGEGQGLRAVRLSCMCRAGSMPAGRWTDGPQSSRRDGRARSFTAAERSRHRPTSTTSPGF